jgi:two-component system, chemotaxis family, sensor kinase CheA
MDLTAFYSQFRDETTENLRVLGDGLLALERNPEDRPQLDAIFRAVHTIKGSARLLGLTSIGQIAHSMEHILGAIREGRRELTTALSNDLLRGADAILELTHAAVEGRITTIDAEAIASGLGRGLETPLAAAGPEAEPAPQDEASGPTAPPAAPAPTPAGRPATTAASSAAPRRQTVRVRVDRLDHLLNLAGELAVDRQVQTSHLHALGELHALVAEQQRSLLALEAELRQLRLPQRSQERITPYLDGLLNTSARSTALAQQQFERMTSFTRRHELLIDDLEQEVMIVRLVAVAAAFANLPRAARDIAQATGKEVDLQLSGEETEIDRKVLELLGDPLTHLLRNAIDHGIELPEERELAGKPRRGTLRIAAEASAGQVQISIADDGRGMDPQRIREAALRKGLLSAEAAASLSDQETLELVFMPGFSTAAIITDISGRGVGLDVVRTNIGELGGQVQIQSEIGRGTTILLLLPLTLVTTRVLLLEAGQQVYALPAASCQGLLWLRPHALRSIEGQLVVQREGQSVALIQLQRVLGEECEPLDPRQRHPALLIGSAQRPAALVIDRLIDEREVVVKPLGPLFERFRQFAGATQLGDGRLVLLLNARGLLALVRGVGPVRAATFAQRRHRLLVAEDSFTTRELVRSILHAAGYEVTVAVDGQDALEKLRGERFDLLLSDVEMPRVNGFQLATSVRRDLLLSEMPVIIMTSLASDEHRRQGLEAGAQAYIVKGQFDQNNLLETIRQLLG